MGYSLSLKVSSLMPKPDRAVAVGKVLDFPGRLGYSVAIPRQHHVNKPKHVEPSPQPPATASVSISPTASTIITNSDIDHGATTLLNVASDSKAPQHNHIDDNTPAAQTVLKPKIPFASKSNEASQPLLSTSMMGSVLQGMMQPEHITQGDTQSQGMQPPPPITELMVSPSPGRCDVLQSNSDPMSQVGILKPALSQFKASKLESAKAQLRKAAHQNVKPKAKQDDVVRCQCGHSREEGDMVNTLLDLLKNLS